MIRIATPDDAPAVHAIYAPNVRDTAISFEWETPTVAQVRSRLKRVLAVRPWPKAGSKFGRWYDVGFWYLPLRPLPKRPHELIPITEILQTRKFNDALKKQAARI